MFAKFKQKWKEVENDSWIRKMHGVVEKTKVCFILTYCGHKPNRTNIKLLSMDWHFPVVEY